MSLFILLLACADGEGDSALDPICQDAPVSTYDNFGQGFVLQHCQSCHASTSEERYGAPEEVSFDDESEVWAHSERILARSTGEQPSMPPQGGVEEADRLRLEQWLRCQ